MKRCPVCNSTRFYGNKKIGWKCERCGFINYGRPRNDGIDGVINGIVKKPVSHQETIMNSPLYDKIHDLHNNAYKFRITRDAEVDWPKQPGFRGNIQAIEFNGFKVKKTSKWLIVYKDGRNKIPLRELMEISEAVLKKMVDIALEISRRYNFEIDPSPLPFASNRPEVKTGFVSALNFLEEEVQAVYPVPGPIEMKGKNAVKNSYNLTESLANLLELTKIESKNKIKHDAVLEGILGGQKEDTKIRERTLETLEAIKNSISPRPPGPSDKIRNVDGLRLAIERTKPLLDILKEVFK